MNVGILEPLADILPGLAAVKASNDAAMFESQVNTVRIFRIDVDMTHVPLVRRMRKIPFVLNFGGHLGKRFKLLPGTAPVFAAIEMNRFGSGVNDAIISWVNRHPSNIAFEGALPMPAGILSAVQTVKGYACKDNLLRMFTSVNGIHHTIFEVRLKLPRTAHRSPNISDPPKQNHSRLSTRIESVGFSHFCPSEN